LPLESTFLHIFHTHTQIPCLLLDIQKLSATVQIQKIS
jgi:hypothetical protein